MKHIESIRKNIIYKFFWISVAIKLVLRYSMNYIINDRGAIKRIYSISNNIEIPLCFDGEKENVKILNVFAQ